MGQQSAHEELEKKPSSCTSIEVADLKVNSGLKSPQLDTVDSWKSEPDASAGKNSSKMGPPSPAVKLASQCSLVSFQSRTSGPRMEMKSLQSLRPSSQLEDFDEKCISVEDSKSVNPKFKRAFDLIDADGDGKIDCDQLVTFLYSKDHTNNEYAEVAQKKRYLQHFMPQFTNKARGFWIYTDFESFMMTNFQD